MAVLAGITRPQGLPDGMPRGLPATGRIVLPRFVFRGSGGAWTADSLTLGVTPTAQDIILAAAGWDNTFGPGYPTLTGFTFRMLLYYHDGTAGLIAMWLGEPSPYHTGAFGTSLAFNWSSGSFPGCEALVYRLIDPDAQFRGRVLAKTVSAPGSSTTHSIGAPATPQPRGGIAVAAVRRDTGSTALDSGPASPWNGAGLAGVLTAIAAQPLSRSKSAKNPSAGTATWTGTGGARSSMLGYVILE